MSLPCNECKGKCCEYPAMSKKEYLALRMAKPLPKGAKIIESSKGVVFIGTCPYLEDGKCSVWNVRPKVCRLYGEIDELPCVYLHPDKAEKLIDKFISEAR